MASAGTPGPPPNPCRGFTRAWASAAAAATAALGRGRAAALAAATAAANTAVAAADAPPDAPAVVVLWVHLGAGGGAADRADGLGWLLDGLAGRGGDDDDPRGGGGGGGEPPAHLLVALEDADAFPPEVVRDLIYLAALRNHARRRALAASAAATAAAAAAGAGGAGGRGRGAGAAAPPVMDAGLPDAEDGWGWGQEDPLAADGGADGETGGAPPPPPGVTIIAGVGGPAGVRRCVSALGCRERGVMRPAAVGLPPPAAAIAAILRATVIGRDAPVIAGPGVVVGLTAHAEGVAELLGALRLVYATHFWDAPLGGPLSLSHLRCRPPPTSRVAGGDGDDAEAGWAASPLAILDGAPVAPVVSHAAVERILTPARLVVLRPLPSVSQALAGAPPGTAADVGHAVAWLTGWSHWRAAAAAAEACVRHVVAAAKQVPAAAVAVQLHLAIANVHLDVGADEAEAAEAAAAAAEADSDDGVSMDGGSWVPPAPVVLTPGVPPPGGDAGDGWPDPTDTPAVVALSEVPLIRAASGYIAGMGRVELRQLADAWAAILAVGGDSAEGGWAGESLPQLPGADGSVADEADSDDDMVGDAPAAADAEDGPAAWAAAAEGVAAAGDPGAPLTSAPLPAAGRSTLPPRAPPVTGVLRPLHAAVAAIAEALVDAAAAPLPPPFAGPAAAAAAAPAAGAIPPADDVRASLLAGARGGGGGGGGGSAAVGGGGAVGAKRRRAEQFAAAATAAASSAAAAGTLPARTAAAAALRMFLGCLTDPRRLPLAEVVVADAVDADGGDGGTAVAAEFVGAAKVLQFLGVVRAGGRRGDTVSRLFYPH
ncbi:hypothetical protein I4F81_012596 [Pyropia yezoensis]|uniref:Uncharacterized protein n=1 Tax=Pyropia yezoensis TaxID=2788 RepID=A0ACC3CJ67_PYRYE|nr:hypothetical protein I4F81_012596 [Neopyropia yezoensis]